MNVEPITEQNRDEVNAFLRRTGGKVVTENWNGFIVRNDLGEVWGVFQHALIRAANFHVDPVQQNMKTLRFMAFCQDFVRAVIPGTLTMCDRQSPLLEPALKTGMVDTSEKTAFLKIGEN